MDDYTLDYSLSLENFKNIPFQLYEKDFTFIVDGKQYKTNRIIADLLSPQIRKYHFSDQFINEFTINTREFTENKVNNPSSNNYFDEFLSIALFSNTKFDSIHFKYFMEYFYLLGNANEYLRLLSHFMKDLTFDNAIDCLYVINELGMISTDEFEKGQLIAKITKFIAQNFDLVNKEKLKSLKLDVLEIILQQDSLKLQNEDSLLQFILSLYIEDHSYSHLFEYVIFSNITEECFSKFANIFDFENLNIKIWSSICQRQNSSQSKNMNRAYSNFIKTFNYSKGNDLDGILKYLTRETGGNIYENGTIDITSNSIFSNRPDCHPKNLIDYDKDNFYQSKDTNGSFIIFDFKDKLVQLTNYTIQNGLSKKNYYLKNWVLEVSNDGNDWDVIDIHNDDNELNKPNVAVTFNIQIQNSCFYRFVRLRQTGQSWCETGKHFSFWFPYIEFYGKMKFI